MQSLGAKIYKHATMVDMIEHLLNKQQVISVASESPQSGYVSALAAELKNFGFLVDIRGAIMSPRSSGALLEIIVTDFSAQYDDLLQEAMDKRNLEDSRVPLIYVSSDGSFNARHKAVKYGGNAFLLTDSEEIQLLDTLDSLLSKTEENLHVLIVDDDDELSAYYSVILENEGIKCITVDAPRKALPVLQGETIDLVLLDLNMPECNGLEFARMLRQLNDYVRLPIIFVSTERSLQKILWEEELGADDFLVKPVSDERLIKSVKQRAARAQVLKQFMIRDSATRLLNHNAFKSALMLESKRAARHECVFSYALIDLDFFKKVNDTYGHAAGDVVLKTFAYMLRSRLRSTDVVGRYGGEEFGIVLVNSPAESSKQVMEHILETFSKTAFKADGKKFFVTFSAGIAEFKYFPSFAQISGAADAALYEAKNNGRNQVVIAAP